VEPTFNTVSQIFKKIRFSRSSRALDRPGSVAHLFSLGNMKPPVTFFALLVLTVVSGCTRTYISTGDPGVSSPDGDTRLILTGHGAYGRSYLDRTKKLLDVSIVRGALPKRQMLYSHRYKFQGADLWGHVQWDSTNKVVVYVYDYGDGVYAREAQKSGTPSNHVATLFFELDRKSGKFAEKK
jgi:hypothetical protein